MKNNLDSIYKNMKPDELASIAFSAIGKEDVNTWGACVSNVPSKKYVMLDIGYTQKLKNQIDFSVFAGLQFFKQSFKLFAVIQQQRDNLNKKKEASIDDLMEQDRLFDKEMMKYRILLTLINSLCDKYQIDKKTCLSFVEMNMTIDDLEAKKEVEPRFWSDEVKTYHEDMKYILETTINPNANDDDKK